MLGVTTVSCENGNFAIVLEINISVFNNKETKIANTLASGTYTKAAKILI